MPDYFAQLVEEYPQLGYLRRRKTGSKTSNTLALQPGSRVRLDAPPGELYELLRSWHDQETAVSVAQALFIPYLAPERSPLGLHRFGKHSARP